MNKMANMKKFFFFAVLIAFITEVFGQKDSTAIYSDTVKVGSFIIIRKNKNQPEKITASPQITVNLNGFDKTERRPSKKKNLSTNWWIFDLGFTNMRDETDYTYAQAGNYFKTLRQADGKVNANSYHLQNGKSSNVNFWFFAKKLNLNKHILNLKYGLGLEMYNFRYDTRLSYRKDTEPFVFNDSISFSKNKLFVKYITVPLMINYHSNPDKKNSFSMSAGLSAGYLLASRNKQISNERGKQKVKGDFNFTPFRVAAVGELGLGPVRLYGSYSLNKLQKDITRVEQFPFAIGIRFSNW